MALSASWTLFLKLIASYNGDLSSLTAPPFILSPTSLVEYSQYWAEHPDLLVEPAQLTLAGTKDQNDAMAVKRMIAVVRWFVLTLRSQYCLRSESMGSEKKPLNPFLGEVFVGKWPDTSAGQTVGETVLLSEQVLHHPPVTAYAVHNAQHDTVLQGYNRIKATISATSINVKQYGHALLEYRGLGELYLVTLPPLHIEGLLVASPFVELEGTSYIQCLSGYLAVIEYSGRGYFLGKKNTFKARVYTDKVASGNKDNALVTISGQWSDKLYIRKGGKSPTSSDEVFFDASKDLEHLLVKPLEQQHALELRKAWAKVAAATRKGDYDLILKEKSLIENEQRDLRKQEREAGVPWKTRWFDEVDVSADGVNDPLVSLANVASLSIGNVPLGSLRGSKHETDTALHWRFNPDRWAAEKEITI